MANLASCSHSKRDRGWYSYLNSKEQSILNNESISISRNSIPDDLIEGISLQDIVELHTISDADHQNSIMFCDGSVNFMSFQHKVQTYQHQYSLKKNHFKTSLPKDKPSAIICTKHILQVPDITSLKESINIYIMKLDPSYVNVPQQSWNLTFYKLITDCTLSSHFPPSTLPKYYRKGKPCGHILHVDLSELVTNTFYLTMMDSNKNLVPSHYSDSAPMFIHSTIFHNPVWDIGLQFILAPKNSDKIYTLNMESLNTYSSMCVCPRSSLLSKWHQEYMFNKMPKFWQCEDNVF